MSYKSHPRLLYVNGGFFLSHKLTTPDFVDASPKLIQ